MIVHRIEDEDRREVTCTTYQMRNPFRQFADGLADVNDLHCYAQHVKAASLCPDGGRVLDMCCGRGLLIPFLRYQRSRPTLYVGVDVEPKNAKWEDCRDPRREVETKTDWGFERIFVEANVAEMTEPVRSVSPDPFDLVVYTSSIEHMQPETQRASLVAAAELAGDAGVLYLSCPVTEPGRSGYDCRYRAHVYEPKLSELGEWLEAAGWKASAPVGLASTSKRFRQVLKGPSLSLAETVYASHPRFLALAMIAGVFPTTATEVALICRKEAP